MSDGLQSGTGKKEDCAKKPLGLREQKERFPFSVSSRIRNFS